MNLSEDKLKGKERMLFSFATNSNTKGNISSMLRKYETMIDINCKNEVTLIYAALKSLKLTYQKEKPNTSHLLHFTWKFECRQSPCCKWCRDKYFWYRRIHTFACVVHYRRSSFPSSVDREGSRSDRLLHKRRQLLSSPRCNHQECRAHSYNSQSRFSCE